MVSIRILYDNYGYSDGFSHGWGFSALIERKDRKILFDFGEAWGPLRDNMKLAGISPESIDIAFLSHDHWDHNGGLKGFLSGNKGAELFLPADFGGMEVFDAPSWEGSFEGRKAIFIKEPMEIAPGIFSSGSLKSDAGVMEQALGIETGNGMLAVLGCSHPGVDALVERLGEFGDVRWIMGGFHGFDRLEYLKGFDLVVPTHCTKKRKEIMELLGEKALPGGSGFVIEL